MKKETLMDARNRKLYDRVREYYKVNLKKSDDHSWSSHIEKGAVIICHSQTKYPISAFTHELLHIDTQLNGYKKIRGGLSLKHETHRNLVRICRCLDNELQHHKMIDKFVSLGFPTNEFYNDLDTETVPYLEKILKRTDISIISLSVDFVTLIAPGGIIPIDKYECLKQEFYDYENGKYLDKFKTIEKIIADWKADINHDAEKYIINFFQNLGAGQTWITYADDLDKGISNENFPTTGFFTDNSFTIEELAKAFGK